MHIMYIIFLLLGIIVHVVNCSGGGFTDDLGLFFLLQSLVFSSVQDHDWISCP